MAVLDNRRKGGRVGRLHENNEVIETHKKREDVDANICELVQRLRHLFNKSQIGRKLELNHLALELQNCLLSFGCKIGFFSELLRIPHKYYSPNTLIDELLANFISSRPFESEV